MLGYFGSRTCEHRGRSADNPDAAEPVVVPAPPAAAEAQIQDVAAAARVAEWLTVEENVGRAAVGQLSEELRDQIPVLPEGLEDAEGGAKVICHP